jgi:hypothetical protein
MPVHRPTSEIAVKPFGPPESVRPPETSQLGKTDRNWRVIHDMEQDLSTMEVIKDEGIFRIEEIDLEMEKYVRERYTFKGDDFDSVCGEVISRRGLRRGDWYVHSITRTVLTSDAENFYLWADLDAYEGDVRVYCQSWDRTIPRKLV